MSNQTLQSPRNRRRAQPKGKSAKSAGTIRRQTARLEGRRDGKPLIFGWGGHLTRTQKTRIQERTAYTFFGLVIVVILGVFVFGWIQQNILIPNQAIVTVNGTSISQDTYRKELAYDAQVLWNHLQSELQQQAALQPKLSKNDPTAVQQNAVLTEHIQTDEANYAQAQITQSTIDELVNDQLIQQGITRFEQQAHVAPSVLVPSSAAIDAQLAAFKKSFPKGETYAQFLQKDNLTDADVRAAIAIHLRHDLMQKYLASQLVSPAKQVHLRRIQTNTAAIAQKVYDQLRKNPNDDALWNTLAKQYTLDVNSKNVGGDMGWVPHGTGDAAIDNWAYTPGRKVGDLSGVIKDADGTFDVVQVLGIDPSRPVDPTLLKAAQDNAISHWIAGQKVAPGAHITTPDSTMLGASRNLPVMPNLNATLPNENPQGSNGGTIPGITGP
jgi:hypothetical protein